VDFGRTAFFFDFDGTLAEIAPQPHLVEVAPRTVRSLSFLSEGTGGAVAVVSGREIADIDGFLFPLILPAAGVHGVEIRHSDRTISRALADEAALQPALDAIEHFARLHEGLLVEQKHGSVALHYRQRPDLARACMALADRIAGEGRLHVLHGKMVMEFKASPLTKGTAIAELMSEKPFKDRRALFVGDDITDEHGFAAVNRMDGISVKVGEGETSARFRLPGVAAVGDWLAALALGGIRAEAS
jgi:trehalose 6-phosphate phosphatase